MITSTLLPELLNLLEFIKQQEADLINSKSLLISKVNELIEENTKLRMQLSIQDINNDLEKSEINNPKCYEIAQLIGENAMLRGMIENYKNKLEVLESKR